MTPGGWRGELPAGGDDCVGSVPLDPPVILSAIREHLATYIGKDPSALVFTTPAGRPIRGATLNQHLNWSTAVEKLNKPGLHFHDLRHTGNTLAAQHEGPNDAPEPGFTSGRDDLPARHLRGRPRPR